MTSISVENIEVSKAESGKVLVTQLWTYPRFIHGEVMTHRVFSRNAASSRAIPTPKMLAQVWNDPALPVYWGANQPGMQAKAELTGWRLWAAKKLWVLTGKTVCGFVWAMNKIGLHKQIANRPLETWQWMKTIVSSTEWENFDNLRNHPDAQPEFQVLARSAIVARQSTSPTELDWGNKTTAGWHLPFVTESERATQPLDTCIAISAARCARVSYLTHDNKRPDIAKDLELFKRLVGSVPLHASPIEHQACSAHKEDYRSGNFKGFEQYRGIYELKVHYDGLKSR
jgi:hypothetical protein